MTVLRLRLASPLQSWGAPSRFTRRATEASPTKSGILGLLCAAQGRRRSDPIEDLLGLQLGVRTEQQGVLLRDFHTAHHLVSGQSMPLTERFYWSDAVFTAHIGGPSEVLEGLAEALGRPAFPLYFGRRSCVPTGRIVVGLAECSVAESLKELEWLPGFSGRRRHRRQEWICLAVQADAEALPGTHGTRELNDVPVSFDPYRRQYRTRVVVDSSVEVPTGTASATGPVVGGHDPMALLGGIS